MKVLADENCERGMVDTLRMAGHDVVTLLDIAPSISDDEAFSLAHTEGRILLTSDRDFGLIAEHAETRPPAIILMRLERLSFRRRVEIVLQTFAELGDRIPGQFIVIEPHQLRSRCYEP